jgi:hypothetical protein
LSSTVCSVTRKVARAAKTWASIECVTCHASTHGDQLNPPTHTITASSTTCVTCHAGEAGNAVTGGQDAAGFAHLDLALVLLDLTLVPGPHPYPHARPRASQQFLDLPGREQRTAARAHRHSARV